MADFKKNVTNISKEDRDKYFQLPQDFKKYVDKKDIQKKSLEHSKKRQEEQLENRKKYVELLEVYYFAMKQLQNAPSSTILKEEVEKAKLNIDIHNTEIEIKNSIIKANTEIETAIDRYYSAKAELTLTREMEKIEQVRFDKSAISINDLLYAKARNQKSLSSFIHAGYTYRNAQFYLDYLMESGESK